MDTGRGVGSLKHHPDTLAELDDLHVLAVDVVAYHVNPTFGTHVAEALVDAVDAAQEGGFSTA